MLLNARGLHSFPQRLTEKPQTDVLAEPYVPYKTALGDRSLDDKYMTLQHSQRTPDP